MPREKLRFDVNVPLAVALIHQDGLDVTSQYNGRQEVLYTVNTEVGERVMYVDPIVRRKIDEAGLVPGEWFRLGKFSVKNGNNRFVEWKLERIPPEEEVPGVATPEPPPQQSARLNAQPKPTTRPPAPANGKPAALPAPPAAPAAAPPEPNPPARPRTQLEDALKTVIAALHAANLYAKEIGFQMPPFTSEDLRTMANTIMIGLQQRNGGVR